MSIAGIRTMIDDHERLEALIKTVVTQTVPAAVNDTLEKMGIDYKNPLNVQKDMAFLSMCRKGAGIFLIAFLTSVAAGAVQFWQWVSSVANGPHGP